MLVHILERGPESPRVLVSVSKSGVTGILADDEFIIPV
jgi:hypothetical protein